MKKTGLSLRAPTQGVRAEIYLITVVVKPEDAVTVIFELEIVKAGGIESEEVEHLTICKHRPQISDTGKPSFQTILTTPNMTGSALCMATISVTARSLRTA
jgi:hypothetical protein